MKIRTTPVCPLCGSGSPTVENFTGYSVAACYGCDLAFNFYPPDHSLMHLFADQYVDSITAGEWLQHYTARRRMKTIAHLSGSLIEVGCGVGYFLRAAAKRFAVAGIDNSPNVLARTKLMCPEATLHEAEALPDNTFDVICGFHVVEHMTDPIAFASEAREKLNPGGVLYLRVPNWKSEWADYQGRKFFLEGHCSHFTPASLDRTLRLAGFNDIAISTDSFAGRWLYAMCGPLISAGSRAVVPVNRAYQEGRRTTGLRAKRAALTAFHLAELACDIAARPVLAALSRRGRGEELVAVARQSKA